MCPVLGHYRCKLATRHCLNHRPPIWAGTSCYSMMNATHCRVMPSSRSGMCLMALDPFPCRPQAGHSYTRSQGGFLLSAVPTDNRQAGSYAISCESVAEPMITPNSSLLRPGFLRLGRVFFRHKKWRPEGRHTVKRITITTGVNCLIRVDKY